MNRFSFLSGPPWSSWPLSRWRQGKFRQGPACRWKDWADAEGYVNVALNQWTSGNLQKKRGSTRCLPHHPNDFVKNKLPQADKFSRFSWIWPTLYRNIFLDLAKIPQQIDDMWCGGIKRCPPAKAKMAISMTILLKGKTAQKYTVLKFVTAHTQLWIYFTNV